MVDPCIKNVIDSESVKSKEKLRGFKIAVLTV